MNSNKKKTAIIVGSVATALLASAAIATALYLKGKNKLDKPKDKTTFIDFGISKEDQKEFGAHDAKAEEEFKKIRKYIEKIIENLNKGINEAGKDLSIQDYNVLINYLKDGIKIGEDAFLILDKSIKALAEYLEKQKLLQDDRKRLAETIEKAKEAIASAQSKLDGLLKDKSKVEKRAETIIRQIKEAIERAEKGVIIPEFKASIKELEELSAAAEEIKTKAKIFDLNDIINKLDSAINDAKAEIQILKDKISKQDEAAQKEAIKKFADELKDKVDKAIKKGEDAQTVEELEEAKKQIDTLKDVASEAAKEANKLNEPEAKAKIESQLQRLEEESKKLNKRIEEKKAKDSELKNELKELLEELKKAGEDAQNAQSLNDLNKAIAELEAKIAKGQALQLKLNQAKLTDEADTLKKALEKAAEILTDAKNRKDAENTRINELKNKLNNQKQDLESKTNNTKSKESISELENALSELNKSINNAETLNNDAKDDKSKESFKDEYNAFAKALEDAKNQAQSSQQKLDALKQAKSELDRKVAEAISKANEAIEEANNNKNSEDKDKLSSVLEQISKAKSELEKAKQDSETANDSENKKKCEDKLAELETAKAEIETQKTKVENKEKEIAKSKEAVKEQIESLDKEIANVDKAISDKNKANIGLAKTELDKEITKAEELLEKIKNEPKLNQEHIDLNSKITDAKNKSKAAEEALKNINKAEDDAKKATQEAKQELDKAINDAKTANPNKLDDLKEKQKQLDEAIEKGNNANKQADEAGVNDQDLKDKLKEAEKEKKTLEEKIKKAEQDNINQIKQKINDAISALDGAISKVNDATQDANKHDLEKTEEAIAKIANALKTANDTKSETEANQSKYQTEFNSLVSKIADAEQKQTEILKQKQDIENERKVADEEYKTLKQNVDANILFFENNSDKLDKVTEAISNLEANLNTANTLLNKTKNIKYNALQTNVEALITQINEKLIAARAKKQELKDAQQAEKQRIEALKKKLTDSVAELSNKISTLESADGIDDKEKALNELSEAIAEANEIAKDVQEIDKTTNVKNEWDAFSTELGKANNLKQTKEDEIANIKSAIDTEISEIQNEVKKALKNADQAISNKNKTELKASKSELEKLVKKLQELKEKIEALKYETAKEKVTLEQEKVNEKLQKIDEELNSEEERIKQVKKELENSLAALKETKKLAEENKDNIDKLENALVNLETQYALSNAKYNEHNITKNKSISKLAEALTDLKNELDACKTFKESLKTQNKKVKEALDKKLTEAIKNADDAISALDSASEDKTKITDAKDRLEKSKKELEKLVTEATNQGYKKVADIANNKLEDVNKKLKDAISKLDTKVLDELRSLIEALTQSNTNVNKLGNVDDLDRELPLFNKLVHDTQIAYNKLNTPENKNNQTLKQELDKLNNLLAESNQTYSSKNSELNSKKQATKLEYEAANNFATNYLNEAGNLNGKSVVELETLISNLQTAKEKANGAKSLASANGYSQYETQADKLIEKIEKAITEVTQAKIKLAGEDKLAKELIEKIDAKKSAIIDAFEAIKDEHKSKIDAFSELISELESKVTEGIRYHNDENKQKPGDAIYNNLLIRQDVIDAFAALKQKTDEINPTEINKLKEKLLANKKVFDDRWTPLEASSNEAIEAAKSASASDKNALESAKVKLLAAKTALSQLETDLGNDYSELKTKVAERLTEVYRQLEDIENKLQNKITAELEALINKLKEVTETLNTTHGVDPITSYLNSNVENSFNKILEKANNEYNNNKDRAEYQIDPLKSKLAQLKLQITESEKTKQKAEEEANQKKQAAEQALETAKTNSKTPIEEGEKPVDKNTPSETIKQRIHDLEALIKENTGSVWLAKKAGQDNSYSKVTNEADALIRKINNALEILKNNLSKSESEEERVKNLEKDIDTQIATLTKAKDEANLAKGKFDTSTSKLSTLESVWETSNTKYQNWFAEENKKAPLLEKLNNLKLLLDEVKKLDGSGLLKELKNANQSLGESVAQKVNEISNKNELISVSELTSKSIEDLKSLLNTLGTETIGYLKEANEAKVFAQTSDYAAQATKANETINSIKDKINKITEEIERKENAEKLRIKQLKQKIEAQIQAIEQKVNTLKVDKNNVTQSNYQALKEELKTANELNNSLTSETSLELNESKEKLEKTIKLATAKNKAYDTINTFEYLDSDTRKTYIRQAYAAVNETEVEDIIENARKANEIAKANIVKIFKEKLNKLKQKIQQTIQNVRNNLGKKSSADFESDITALTQKFDEANTLTNEYNKYAELQSEIETFKNTEVKAASDMINEARDYVEKGWQDKEFRLHQLDESLKTIEQFIKDHQTINEDDKNKWEEQRDELETIRSDSQAQNSIFSDFHNYKYQSSHPNVQSLANGMSNRWQDTNTKISKALEEIEKKIAAKAFYDKAKKEIQELKWISNSKRNQKLAELENNKNDLIRMQEILTDAKKVDETTKKLVEKNQELSKRIKQFPINQKLFNPSKWMNEQFSFQNERANLDSLYNQNHIDYRNDVEDDVIIVKNNNIENQLYPIINSIISKSKQMFISMYNDFKGWTADDSSFNTNASDIRSRHEGNNKSPFFAFGMKMTNESSNYRGKIDSLPTSSSENNYTSIINKFTETINWFNASSENYFFNHKDDVLAYYRKINSLVRDFENKKYFQLSYIQNMPKYNEVKKLYKDLLDTQGTEIYKLLYEKTDNYTSSGSNSEYDKFEKLYKNIEYQIEKKFNEINLKEFVENLTDFKWENAGSKLISELVRAANNNINEHITFKIRKGNFITPSKYKVQNLQASGNLGSIAQLKENNYAIYDGFGLTLDDIKYSDIDGKLQFSLKAYVWNNYFDPNKNSSEVITGTKHIYTISGFTKISKKIFNVHAHAEKSSNSTNNQFTTIEQLIDILKSYKPEINGTNEHNIEQIFNFTNLPNDGTVIRIDHDSLRKLGSAELQFKLKFFKSNVPHIKNGEQKYVDFELDSRELKVDFTSTLQTNIRSFLQNQRLNYKYTGSTQISNLLASQATPSNFTPTANTQNPNYDYNLVSVVGDDEHGKARLLIRLRSKLFPSITHEYYQEISNFKKDEPSEIKQLEKSDYKITNKNILASQKERQLSSEPNYGISKFQDLAKWFEDMLSDNGKNKFDSIISAEMNAEDYKLNVTYFVKKTVKIYNGVKDIRKKYTTTLDLKWFLEPLRLKKFHNDIHRIRENLNKFHVFYKKDWSHSKYNYFNFKPHNNIEPTKGIKDFQDAYIELKKAIDNNNFKLDFPQEREDNKWEIIKQDYKNIKEKFIKLLEIVLPHAYSYSSYDTFESTRIFHYWMTEKEDPHWKALLTTPGSEKLSKYFYIYYPKYLLKCLKDWNLELSRTGQFKPLYYLHDVLDGWELPDELK
ncbi:hypothetical protein [Metamycoplasma equirhinis]|uniref:hypothetical protein n=6 Tax=Metamycoplasma equirhinis TaxID=92402 RepID=UPI00359441A3